MASSNVKEVPVFADTSLGTHMAMSISPDITVAEFKRKLESMHSNCFPEIGKIKVNGLMVKKKSYFYHLPELLPIKHAFHGVKGTWFIYMEAYPSDKICSTTREDEGRHGCPSKNTIKDKWKRKKRVSAVARLSKKSDVYIKTTVKKDHRQESNACRLVEPPSKISSESVSVSGIIKKYFSVYDEATSTAKDGYSSKLSTDKMKKYAPKTPPRMRSSSASRDYHKTGVVGKRIIVAANNLGISSSKRKPMVSLCKYSNENLSVLKATSLVRNLIFDFNNSEERIIS